MTEIVYLVPRPDQQPNAEVVAQIELLLDLARQGAIQSFAYVADNPACGPWPAVGHSGGQSARLCGGAILLRNELLPRS